MFGKRLKNLLIRMLVVFVFLGAFLAVRTCQIMQDSPVTDPLGEETTNTSTTTQTNEDDSDATEQTQRIGAEGIGFLEVPASWMELSSSQDPDSIQWYDTTNNTIATLDIFDLSALTEEERASFTTEDAANYLWDNLLAGEYGLEEDNIQGAQTELIGREAMQVYAIYPDGTHLVAWVLNDDAGVIRFVSVEGPEDAIADAVKMVEDTYEL